MRRREFLTGLLLAAGTDSAQAQTPAKMHRLALVNPSRPTSEMTETGPSTYFRALFAELRRLGYVEGHNLLVRRHSGEGRAEILAELARDVVRQQPDVIGANTGRVAQHLKAATTTIPIVITTSDPVGLGLAASLSRPGGNVTGYSTEPSLEVYGKYLEILGEIRPKLTKVAFLAPKAMWNMTLTQALQQAADRAGVVIVGPGLESPIQEAEYRRVLAAMRQGGAEALIVADSAENIHHRDLIVELARAHRILAIYPYTDFAKASGLVSYAVDLEEMAQVCADYIARILQGTNPADLPFQQPTRLELIVNLAAAKEVGLTIPPTLLARADEVIE
jgi:putative tryptophan/tyrosine transport system substrate-binding protein